MAGETIEIQPRRVKLAFVTAFLALISLLIIWMGWRAFDPAWHASGGSRLTTRAINEMLNAMPPNLRGLVLTMLGLIFAALAAVVIRVSLSSLPLAVLDNQTVRFRTIWRRYSIPWSDVTAIEAKIIYYPQLSIPRISSINMITIKFSDRAGRNLFGGQLGLILSHSSVTFDATKVIDLMMAQRPDLCADLRHDARSAGIEKPPTPPLASGPARKSAPAEPPIVVNSQSWTG